jgi:alkylation response protein AidB-like acyl-CoA dehydrogenase
MGVWPSGTTYITMEDVKVPVENLIGAENNGFKYIMCASVRSAPRTPFCVGTRRQPLTRALAPAPPLFRSRAQVQLQPRAMGADHPGTFVVLAQSVCGPCKIRLAGWRHADVGCSHPAHPRLSQASRFARVCLEEAFKYALKRKTFGKVLMEHPVIRWKVAEMARQVECTHAQLENVTYQMCTMSKKDAMEKARAMQACTRALAACPA